MAKQVQSRKHDIKAKLSRRNDTGGAPFATLRDARLNGGLSQQQLAEKLGLRQRQISDLERAAMDPRLSTVQNVARALDLELMLIPRHLISVVEGLQRAGTGSPKQPMYALNEEDVDSDVPTEENVVARGRPARPIVPGGSSLKEPR